MEERVTKELLAGLGSQVAAHRKQPRSSHFLPYPLSNHSWIRYLLLVIYVIASITLLAIRKLVKSDSARLSRQNGHPSQVWLYARCPKKFKKKFGHHLLPRFDLLCWNHKVQRGWIVILRYVIVPVHPRGGESAYWPVPQPYMRPLLHHPLILPLTLPFISTLALQLLHYVLHLCYPRGEPDWHILCVRPWAKSHLIICDRPSN